MLHIFLSLSELSELLELLELSGYRAVGACRSGAVGHVTTHVVGLC